LIVDEPVDVEWDIRRIGGDVYRARIAIRALQLKSYIRGSVWIIEDITEQKRNLDDLKQSKLRLQRLLNSSLIGILQGNEGNLLTDANEVFTQLCGYSRESLLHQEQIWNKLVSSSDMAICKQAYRELHQTGATAPFEVTLLHKDGRKIPLLISLTYLENSQKEWVVFALDISERHRINQLKTEFISIVSHELRTPLTSIRGALSYWNRALRVSCLRKLSTSLKSRIRIVSG